MSEITFNHSRSGTIDLLPGCTDWSAIRCIFALDSTQERDADYRAIYATDAAGLTIAAKVAHNTAASISDAIAIIGKLLAAADHDHIADHDYSAVGWLLNGLADLQSDVLLAASNMCHALDDQADESEVSDHG